MKKQVFLLFLTIYPILVIDTYAQQDDDQRWTDFISTLTDASLKLLLQLYTHSARLHALNNDFDAALADINTALERYYDSVDSPFDVDPAILAPLFVQRGQIHLFLYEWDKVLEDYNTALQINPQYADPYYYRGVLYYSVRFEREKAIPDFERYLELAPDGELAEKAQKYLTDIRAELEALER